MKRLFRKLYSITPFKEYLFIVLKHCCPIPPYIYKHLYFTGFFKVKIDEINFFKLYHTGSKFENEIFWKGLDYAWEKQTLKYWRALSKVCNVILDVGANTGVFSLVSCAINPNAKVYAFEPIERMYNILVNNVRKNSYNIDTYNNAISNETKLAAIYDYPSEISRQASLNPNSVNLSITQKIEVKCITLDSFVHDNNINDIDLVKVDVESHEYEVLQGFVKCIRKYKPILIIEVLNDHLKFQVDDFLSKLDYVMYQIDEEKGLITSSENKTSVNRNYLCLSIDSSSDVLELLSKI